MIRIAPRALACLALTASAASAADPDYRSYPVVFTPPTVVAGSASVSSATPTLIRHSDGLEVEHLSYTVENAEPGATGEFRVEWSSTREFDTTSPEFRSWGSQVTSTSSTLAAGESWTFFVVVRVDGVEVAGFEQPLEAGDESETFPLAATVPFEVTLLPGRHVVEQVSGVRSTTPVSGGPVVSSYRVRLGPALASVPTGSSRSLTLIVASTGLIAFWRRRQKDAIS